MKTQIKVPWRISDALIIFLAAWVGVPVLVILALVALAQPIPALANYLNALKDGQVMASFGLVVIDAIVALGLVALMLKRYRASWSDLGLRRFNLPRAILYLVVVLIALVLVTGAAFTIITALWPSFNASQPQVNEFTKSLTPSTRHFSFAALVIIPPLIEETVFRGFIFPAFAMRVGPVKGAIITSLLFGLAHWQLNVSVYTLVLSLLLCMMYWRLRSIWPGIFFHMLNNYLVFLTLVKK